MLSEEQISFLVNISDENISDDMMGIISSGYGWITPEGICVPCQSWNHIKILSSLAEFQVLLKEEENLKDAIQCAEEAGEFDGPGGWHCVAGEENRYDDAVNRLYHKAYKIGFVRVGIWEKQNICFEGYKTGILAARRTIRDLSNAAGLSPKIEYCENTRVL